MHKVDIPKWAVDRVIERRGSAHPYADLDPARTALIVVDLQNGFMVDGVAHALCPMAVEIVPNVNRLAAAVRRTGGRVVWIKNTHDPDVAHHVRQDAAREGGQAHRVHERGHDRPPGLSRARHEAGRHGGAEVALQRVPAGVFRPGRPAARRRLRYGADHRHRDQRLLRVLGARRHDDELPHHHGERRQRRRSPTRSTTPR